MILTLICIAFALIGWGLAGPIGAGVGILLGLILTTYGSATLVVLWENYGVWRRKRRELKHKRDENLRYQRNVASVLRREIEAGDPEERIASTRDQLGRLEQEAIEKLGLSRRHCEKAQRQAEHHA